MKKIVSFVLSLAFLLGVVSTALAHDTVKLDSAPKYTVLHDTVKLD